MGKRAHPSTFDQDQDQEAFSKDVEVLQQKKDKIINEAIAKEVLKDAGVPESREELLRKKRESLAFLKSLR